MVVWFMHHIFSCVVRDRFEPTLSSLPSTARWRQTYMAAKALVLSNQDRCGKLRGACPLLRFTSRVSGFQCS